MIIDKIENAGLYIGLNKKLSAALGYLQETDLSLLPLGKYAVDGEFIYLIKSEFTTQIKTKNILEGHKKYIDIHYILEGTEEIGVSSLTNQKVNKAYNSEDDFMLYDSQNENIKLHKGMFAVFFPDDLHLPGLHTETSEEVKKIVLKVKL